MTTRERCSQALAADGKEACYGRGGFWINGLGFSTLKQVSQRYGIISQKRVMRPRISAYGDYATIAMLNGVKS